MTREVALDALWPHLAPDAAAAALHKAAHYARRAMGDRDAVVVRGGTVALAPNAEVSTDVERFETDASAPYGGELLPDDLYEEWTHAARERLRALQVRRLRAGARWEEVLRVEPADEEAHRELMREAAIGGDRAGAVRRFRAMRDALARIGAQPAAESVKLFRDVTRGPAVTAPVAPPDPMSGRAPAIAVALHCLDAAGAGRGGVLLLCGEAGSDKTRVAEAVLAAAAERRWHTLRGAVSDRDGTLGPAVHAVVALLDERPDLLAHLPHDAARGVRSTVRPDAGAVRDLLARAADERGCALLLDDLHDADEATVDLLERLARETPGQRLVVVACWRPSEARPHLRQVAERLEARGQATVLALEPVTESAVPETRYATAADGARIAYQVIGEGPPAMVIVPGFVSNVEQLWEMPTARRVLRRLAGLGRLVIWDKRGTGLSDPTAHVPTMDERMLDMAAVMAEAGVDRAVLIGVSEGGPMSVRFAVEHPGAVAALVLYGTAPCFYRDTGNPDGWEPHTATSMIQRLFDRWGTGALLGVFAPSCAADPVSRELFGRHQRAGASPSMGRATLAAMRDIDLRELLPGVTAPTLVVHRRGDRVIAAGGGRMLASAIPGAVLVELDGDDHFPWLGDMDPVVDEIEAFLETAVMRPAPAGGPA